jgi:hypothetical protein
VEDIVRIAKITTLEPEHRQATFSSADLKANLIRCHIYYDIAILGIEGTA